MKKTLSIEVANNKSSNFASLCKISLSLLFAKNTLNHFLKPSKLSLVYNNKICTDINLLNCFSAIQNNSNSLPLILFPPFTCSETYRAKIMPLQNIEPAALFYTMPAGFLQKTPNQKSNTIINLSRHTLALIAYISLLFYIHAKICLTTSQQLICSISFFLTNSGRLSLPFKS
jgi:hypothetical protein